MTVTHHSDNSSGFANDNSNINSKSNSNHDRITGMNRIQQPHQPIQQSRFCFCNPAILSAVTFSIE